MSAGIYQNIGNGCSWEPRSGKVRARRQSNDTNKDVLVVPGMRGSFDLTSEIQRGREV